jgi:hypothetical protein
VTYTLHPSPTHAYPSRMGTGMSLGSLSGGSDTFTTSVARHQYPLVPCTLVDVGDEYCTKLNSVSMSVMLSISYGFRRN